MGLKPFCCTACIVSPEGRLGLVTVLTDQDEASYNYFALTAHPGFILGCGCHPASPAGHSLGHPLTLVCLNLLFLMCQMGSFPSKSICEGPGEVFHFFDALEESLAPINF